MLSFFILRNKSLTLTWMDSEQLLRFAALAPTYILCKDIAEWRDKAEHGDVFVLNSNLKLVALNTTCSDFPGTTTLQDAKETFLPV